MEILLRIAIAVALCRKTSADTPAPLHDGEAATCWDLGLHFEVAVCAMHWSCWVQTTCDSWSLLEMYTHTDFPVQVNAAGGECCVGCDWLEHARLRCIYVH